MTKKDYITIATALKPYYKYAVDDIEQHVIVMSMITAISKALAKDNPKFNPVRFLDMIRDN